MKLAELLLMEFEAEAAKTRSYFAAMPEDKVGWKPHELSPSLGSLAKHIANLPGFGLVFLTTDSMDASGGPPALPEYKGRADLLQTFEQNCARLREVLAKVSDEYLAAPWAFTATDRVLEQGPRAAMYQLMCVDHMVHHRAQMGVYLRILGVSLPGIYGPSADGPWQPAWPGSTHQQSRRDGMKTNLHLGFQGNCDEAFSFYEKVFGTKRLMTMRYSDAPQGTPVPPDAKDLVMHTSMQVGGITLMGADAPPGKGRPMSGFQISIEDPDQATVKRIFGALSEGGSVFMPLAPTFWSPLFGMCTDKYGVGWMVSVPGQQPA